MPPLLCVTRKPVRLRCLDSRSPIDRPAQARLGPLPSSARLDGPGLDASKAWPGLMMPMPTSELIDGSSARWCIFQHAPPSVDSISNRPPKLALLRSP